MHLVFTSVLIILIVSQACAGSIQLLDKQNVSNQNASDDVVHEVHNLLLYPNTHAWCNVTPIQQVITSPGCEERTIENHVCVGACFSYSVPQTEGETVKLDHCDSCQATKFSWEQLTLNCSDGNSTGSRKMIQMISECSCIACPSDEPYIGPEPDYDDEDLPELFHEQSIPVENTLRAEGSRKQQAIDDILSSDLDEETRRFLNKHKYMLNTIKSNDIPGDDDDDDDGDDGDLP